MALTAAIPTQSWDSTEPIGLNLNGSVVPLLGGQSHLRVLGTADGKICRGPQE